MPQLVWSNLLGQEMLEKAPVPNGKPMVMAGRGYQPPVPKKTFQLCRLYTPFVTKLLEEAGKPTRKCLPKDQYDALPTGPDTVQTGAVPLTSQGLLHTQRWEFEDEQGNTSRQLRTSRFVNVRVNGRLRKGPAGVGIDADVAACKDPEFELAVILPWTQEPVSIDDILASEAEEVAQDLGEDPEMIHALLRDTAQSAFGDALSRQSLGWEVWPSPSTLTLDEGEDAVVEVRLQPGEPRTLAIALAATTELDQVTRIRSTEVSNIVVLELSTSGELNVLVADS